MKNFSKVPQLKLLQRAWVELNNSILYLIWFQNKLIDSHPFQGKGNSFLYCFTAVAVIFLFIFSRIWYPHSLIQQWLFITLNENCGTTKVLPPTLLPNFYLQLQYKQKSSSQKKKKKCCLSNLSNFEKIEELYGGVKLGQSRVAKVHQLIVMHPALNSIPSCI